MKEAPIWTPLATLALALTWLLPNANPPWTSFHKDAWIAVVLWTVFAVLLVKARRQDAPFTVSPVAGVLFVLAVLAVFQWLFGVIHFRGHALLGAAYFLAAALCIALGQFWETKSPDAVGDFMFGAFLIAALVTGGLLLAQWFQVGLWDVWILPIHAGARPYGNLVQPNHAATLMVLGLISLMWLVYRRRLGVMVAVLGVVYLTAMILVTGSRTGLLSLTAIAVVAVGVGFLKGLGRAWLWVLVFQILAVPVGLYIFSTDWGVSPTAAASDSEVVLKSDVVLDRDLTSVRRQVYTGYLTALGYKPWQGYGFGQTLLAQLELSEHGVQLPGLFTWTHNAFLDIALWFGIPAAILAMAAVAATVWRLIGSRPDPARWIYLAAMTAMFLHGMVELPLAYAYFLLPLALLTGAAQSGVKLPNLRLPVSFARGVVLVLGIYLAALYHDYLRVEQSFYTWRFKQSNIGTYHPLDVPDTLVLDPFEALLTGVRAEGALGKSQLDDFREAVLLHPSSSAFQHLAEVQVRSGDLAAAQRTADIAWLVSRPPARQAMALRWAYLSTLNPVFAVVKWKAE